MKSSLLIGYLAAWAGRESFAFAPSLCSFVRPSTSNSCSRSFILGMSEDGYNDEVTKLMAAAARAREEAATLAKVRLSLDWRI
jgi:hypothetical protein